MFERRGKLFQIEKNSDFAYRILALSLPAALVFIMLVSLQLLPASIAIIGYASIILFNIAWLFPITFELQQIKKYISKLSKEEGLEDQDLNLSEMESLEIVKAVNQMHKFWASKAENLEAQAMSDTAVLDTLPDPIMMINQEGVILGANLSARTLLGRNVLDKKIDKIFSSNNFVNAVTRVLSQQTEAEALLFYINKGDKKTPQKIYAHIKTLPWISKGRAVAVVSLYDMTKAMKIEKMQSDFVANASHELRTPLAVISGFVETLQTSAKDDTKAREEFLKIISQQASYMSLLIENLLSLSKIEMNQDTPPEEKIAIEPIIDEVLNSMSLRAKDKSISFIINNQANLPRITADYAQVRQLIQNLCDNAIKYGFAGTDIKIETRTVDKIPESKSITVAKGKAIEICVNNMSEVILPEDINRLTERFYRMQKHKDKNIKGTGLGLSIAKHILMRHKGNMRVDSDNTNGTTFSIFLPVEQDYSASDEG